MNKLQLIKIALLVIAVIFGYKFVESTVSFLIMSLYWYAYSGDFWSYSFNYLFILLIYAAGFFILIRNLNPVARYLDTRSPSMQTFNMKVDMAGLLHIVIICLCVFTLFGSVADVLLYAVGYFYSEVNSNLSESLAGKNKVDFASFKAGAVKIVLASILLFYAYPIAQFFTRQYKDKEAVVETKEIF